MSLILPVKFSDPAVAFDSFANDPWSMLLDAAASDPERGRFAILAMAPTRTILAADGKIRVDGKAVTGDPLAILAEALAEAPPSDPQAPGPFSGGAVGLFGYELGRRIERAPNRFAPGKFDMAVGLYDAAAVYDRQEGRAWTVAAHPGAWEKARILAERLSAAQAPPPPREMPLACHPEIDRETYLARVARVIAYIREGDIFQANFTQRFIAERPQFFRPYDLYRRLRTVNPAPFAAYLALENGVAVATASPERFLRLDREGAIEARPIKGTAPRSTDAEKDREAAAKLASSVKDRAENLMITDLLRNDIGRVAELGSVRVTALNDVESFASLHHLVSVVEARLKPGLGPVDLLRATFPGGSVTGAPKIRAMEIIDELEAAPRGAYCGAIGWIGYDGAMDTSIVIRSVTMTEDLVIAQAGGAIVADSDPEAEYAEMMAKVAPALRVIRGEE